MPIHDVGYRKWKGKLTSIWSRWWIIAATGVRNAFKNRWVRRMLLASWVPAIGLGVSFFLFERFFMNMSGNELQNVFFTDQILLDELPTDAITDEGTRPFQSAQQNLNELQTQWLREQAVKEMAEETLNGQALIAAIESGDPNQLRNKVWCWLLMSFLRYPQGIMTLMIIGLLVPPLISRDVRSRAFLLYYSRPINRIEYILGKLAVPALVLTLITLLPAMGLFFFGLMLSPDLSVVADTWDIPFRIVLASMVCVIPTSLIALLFSSMTQESRFAGFAWFTVWGLGAVLWSVIYQTHVAATMAIRGVEAADIEIESLWSLVSIYSTIGRVQSWIFGLELDPSKALPSIILVATITVVAFIWLYRRVSAPVKI